MDILERYAPEGCDHVTDDMTVQFALQLAEKDREIERLREDVTVLRAANADLAAAFATSKCNEGQS